MRETEMINKGMGIHHSTRMVLVEKDTEDRDFRCEIVFDAVRWQSGNIWCQPYDLSGIDLPANWIMT